MDPVNFDRHENIDAFINPADQDDDVEATASMHRRSLTPEPFIQFAVSNPELTLLLTWLLYRGEKFLRYTIDETGRKTGDAISDKLSEKIKEWLGAYNNLRSPDEREMTSQIIIDTKPQIHLLTRCQDVDEATEIRIESLCRQIELRQNLLEDADSITLARSDRCEEWKFLYATTKSGTVITTEDCYVATVEKREDIGRTILICLCLEHKTTGEERHFETTAAVTKFDEQGEFQFKFNSVPKGFLEEWKLASVSLLLNKRTQQ